MAETKKFCIHSDGLGYCDILSDDTVHHYCVEGPCPHEIIVEYAPVKHGEWIEQPIKSIDSPAISRCSVCDYAVSTLWKRTKYCPNCGCKMDLEVTNGLDQH